MKFTTCVLAVLMLAVVHSSYPDGAGNNLIGGVSPGEALRLGEEMYRNGILPSGKPMPGMIQGDIPIDGTMFSCTNCHLRSGVGSLEGGIITLPTNGEWLFKPLQGTEVSEEMQNRLPDRFQRQFRPAYTDESLARALRDGIDPEGRNLGKAMPRYDLDAVEMEILIHYLKALSSEPSPGVTDTTMSFATVITEDVPAEIGDAVFRFLDLHIQNRNSQSRPEKRRSSWAPFFKGESYTAYRSLNLYRWNLAGPPETWRAQMEEYYGKEPVFALLGGISTLDWTPIHQFSEDHGIPALFPVTDYPVISETDWYTLYFSKGRYQEGETVARYLRGLEPRWRDAPVVQIYRDDRDGRAFSSGLRQTREKLGQPPPRDVILSPDQSLQEQLKSPGKAGVETILVFWTGPDDLPTIEKTVSGGGDKMIFMSASLLGEKLGAIPQKMRNHTYLTYPRSLPGDKERSLSAIRQWAKIRGVQMDDEILQSHLYLIGWMLPGILKHLKADYYRDYLLDTMDMMRDHFYSVGSHPRLSFGPGQRYAAKGCYIVQLGEGPQPDLLPRTGWIIH